MKRRAVFLDRDGVLNRAVVKDGNPYPPAGVDAVEIPPGVVEALQRLKDAGFVLIVVSNQPDVARGATPKAAVEEINGYLAKRMPIDRFIMCYHDSGDGCSCRKPAPGMLLSGAREFAVDLAASYMVGDRWKDVEAGQRAGCRTIFIDNGYAERQPESPDFRVRSFAEAASIIFETVEGNRGGLSCQ
jgi:D-glycero-D-manno-heptose 1,7-bisphosphate phosphatase